MKNISLLPAEYKKLKKSNRKAELMVAVAGILAAMTVFAYVIVKILSSIPTEELKILKVENDNLLKDIQSLKYLNEREESINRSKKLAQKAVGNQPDWLALFYAISQSMPDSLKLSSFKTDLDKEIMVISLQGDARSNTDIAEWMERMRDDELLSTAELLSTSASNNRVSFNIKITVVNDKPFKLFGEAQE